jgi:hypothetical protein
LTGFVSYRAGPSTRSGFGLVAELNEEAGSILIGDGIVLAIAAERRGRSDAGTRIRSDTQISGRHPPLHPESVHT